MKYFSFLYVVFNLLFAIYLTIRYLRFNLSPFIENVFHFVILFAKLFVYNSKKIFLSYCSIKLVKNIRYNACFKTLARFTCDITSTGGREDLYIGGGERI